MATTVQINSLGRETAIAQGSWVNAVKKGQLEVLETAFKVSGVPKELNCPMTDGEYPLHAAIRLGHYQVAKLLVEHSADPTLKDYNGLNAFEYAMFTKDQNALSALINQEQAHLLSLALKVPEQTVNHKQVASFKNQLLAFSASQLKKLKAMELTGLHHVLKTCDSQTLALLIETGSVNLSRENKSSEGLTPLHCTILSGRADLVKELLCEFSADDCLATDGDGLTPIHYAIMLGLNDAAQAMLDKVKTEKDEEVFKTAISTGAEVMPGLNYANLAVVCERPSVLMHLCKQGLKLGQNGFAITTADLLCHNIDAKDPLRVKKSEYLLAAYNIATLAAELTIPPLAIPLTVIGIAANAFFVEEGGFKGQLLFWGGEALNMMAMSAIVSLPPLKAAVDLWRIKNAATSAFSALYQSYKGSSYETAKAIKKAVVCSTASAITIYRASGALKYAYDTIALIPSAIGNALSYPQRAEELRQKEGEVQDLEKYLKAKIKATQIREDELDQLGKAYNAKREKQVLREERLDACESKCAGRGDDDGFIDPISKQKESPFKPKKESADKGSQGIWDRLRNYVTGAQEAQDEEPDVISDVVNDYSEVAPKRHITIGSTYKPGHPDRDALSEMTADNHREYAQTWKITHKMVKRKDILEGQCEIPGDFGKKTVECSPYWRKVKVLKDWLDESTRPQIATDDEWYMMIDDDMVISNHKVDPFDALDSLRAGRDTDLIVAEDPSPWNDGDAITSVNTGALFVKRTARAQSIINQIWERRNVESGHTGDTQKYCPTYGVCDKQATLHEQAALSHIVNGIIGHRYACPPPEGTGYWGDKVGKIVRSEKDCVSRLARHGISVVRCRDENSIHRQKGNGLAVNTFARWGRFYRQEKSSTSMTGAAWSSMEEVRFEHHDQKIRGDQGRWRPGDWMGQTAGVPVFGWYVDDYRNGKDPGPIRRDRIQELIDATVK